MSENMKVYRKVRKTGLTNSEKRIYPVLMHANVKIDVVANKKGESFITIEGGPEEANVLRYLVEELGYRVVNKK